MRMIVHNYTGEDGQSHFEEVILPFTPVDGYREYTSWRGPPPFDSRGGRWVFAWIGITPRAATWHPAHCLL
jgi:hypothetical protein